MRHLGFLLPLFFLLSAAVVAKHTDHFDLLNNSSDVLNFFYSTSISPERHFATLQPGNPKSIPMPPAHSRPDNFTILILPLLTPLCFLVLYDATCSAVGTPRSASLSPSHLHFTSDAGHTTIAFSFPPHDAVAADVVFPSAEELVKDDSHALPLLEEWNSLSMSLTAPDAVQTVQPFITHISEDIRIMHAQIALQRQLQGKSAPSQEDNLRRLGIVERPRTPIPPINTNYFDRLASFLLSGQSSSTGGHLTNSFSAQHPSSRRNGGNNRP